MTPLPAGIDRWSADKLIAAFAAIDDKIGAHPADYLRVDIGSNYVSAEALDPNKPENVDHYTYRGRTVEVKPVDTTDTEAGENEAKRFSSDTVDPAVLAQVIASAVKDSGVEDGMLQGVHITEGVFDQPAPTITANVSGPRESKFIKYDMAGRLLPDD